MSSLAATPSPLLLRSSRTHGASQPHRFVGFQRQRLLLQNMQSHVKAVSKTGRCRVSAQVEVASLSLRELFHLLGLLPNASKQDIKKAYRRLALQYHPDVCRGDDCSVMFQRINSAYQVLIVASHALKEEEAIPDVYAEGLMGVGNEDWQDWEEWMGWDGAGTYDYSPFINSRP